MFLFYIVSKICYDGANEVRNMRKQKIVMDRKELPSRLHWLFENAAIYDSSCSSGARVLFFDTGYYLKIDGPGELAGEAARGRFFHSLGLGVEVVDYFCEDRDYLVTRMAEGEDMTHHLDDPKRLCRVLADTLRQLHSRPVENVPVSPRLERYLESARTGAGYYDESVLMDRFPVASREEAWAIMQENKHRLKADTLIHGDACLPNIILKDWGFSSFIDFSLAGAGDRHIDLYWALWSLQFNLKTESYTDYFLDCYGREHFDMDMLRVVAAFELFG